MRSELLAQADDGSAVVGVDAQEELRLGHVCLDLGQLVEVVECRARHAGLAGEDQRRRRFAWVCEQDPRRVDDALVEDQAHLFHRGAVEARVEVREQFEEDWVGIALHGCLRCERVCG